MEVRNRCRHRPRRLDDHGHRLRADRRMTMDSASSPAAGSREFGPDGVLRTMDHCTKCGICRAYCPVASVTELFPGPKYTGPQAQRFRVIDAVDERSSKLCSGCGICTSVCPNGVAVSDIIAIARATAVGAGDNLPLRQRLLNRPDAIGRAFGAVPRSRQRPPRQQTAACGRPSPARHSPGCAASAGLRPRIPPLAVGASSAPRSQRRLLHGMCRRALRRRRRDRRGPGAEPARIRRPGTDGRLLLAAHAVER